MKRTDSAMDVRGEFKLFTAESFAYLGRCRFHMPDQQDILNSASILVAAPRDESAMNQWRDRMAARIQQAVERAMSSESVEWHRECAKFHHLESSAVTENARRCFYCSTWATDRTKLDAIDGLMPGCELDGRWVCDQCIERHDQSTPTA